MIDLDHIQFVDNSAATANKKRYEHLIVDTKRVVESWKDSIFSFEWITPEGNLKKIEELSETEQEKRAKVEEKIKSGMPLQKSILGIGLEDNIEIGSARAEFLTLAALGLKEIPVHIPKSNENDFKGFLADE